ncbi:RING/U-box superfamily protein [Capsicum annuum]|nr:RING/U-box superfamily protein [Capsicum annuum]
MKRDIADFVAKCATCQQVKVEHQRPGGMLQKFGIPLEVETGEYGFGDHFTPLHRQPDSIWVIIDRLTKSTYFLPVYTSYTAENYAKLYIRELVRLYYPSIQMDLFEDLYGRRCRSPVGWFEVGAATLIWIDMVFEAMEKV